MRWVLVLVLLLAGCARRAAAPVAPRVPSPEQMRAIISAQNEGG
jgi:PBP1b-binding outer membrane lipoprotein LpoB